MHFLYIQIHSCTGEIACMIVLQWGGLRCQGVRLSVPRRQALWCTEKQGMYVCVYMHLYVVLNSRAVSMHVFTYVCIFVCMHIHVYLCTFICTYIHTYMRMMYEWHYAYVCSCMCILMRIMRWISGCVRTHIYAFKMYMLSACISSCTLITLKGASLLAHVCKSDLISKSTIV